MAPKTQAIPPSDYSRGERIGNVSRETAVVMSTLMDSRVNHLSECNIYGTGFKFKCILDTDSNHHVDGYPLLFILQILTYSP
jgi:hypothetical protein